MTEQTETSETYESWTKEQLHDELASRGLIVSGTKDEQMTRLEEDDARAASTDAVSDDAVEEAEVAEETDTADVADWGPTPRVPPEGPFLTEEQATELNRAQADYPHDTLVPVWDENGENPSYTTPDGESHKLKA